MVIKLLRAHVNHRTWYEWVFSPGYAVFTYWDDLHAYIASKKKFQADPFYFRIYFDTFIAGGKGKMAHVLMIDVDRPSIDKALIFFQSEYNGEAPNSPNDIPYMFSPLLHKSYMDDERNRIITDHAHFTGRDSVVALRGLQDLETVIALHNGVHTTIRRLLLSIPAAGATTGHLFIQIEKQSMNDWLLCCFHSADAAKVTFRLSLLEDILVWTRTCTIFQWSGSTDERQN
jgi:hypothetical protein